MLFSSLFVFASNFAFAEEGKSETASALKTEVPLAELPGAKMATAGSLTVLVSPVVMVGSWLLE